MDNEEIVLNSLNDYIKNEKGDLDIMDNINAKKLNISECEFSKALFALQNKGNISGVIFDDNSMAVMWDDICVDTDELKLSKGE